MHEYTAMLRALRGHYTLESLGAHLEVNHGTVSRWRSDKCSPPDGVDLVMRTVEHIGQPAVDYLAHTYGDAVQAGDAPDLNLQLAEHMTRMGVLAHLIGDAMAPTSDGGAAVTAAEVGPLLDAAYALQKAVDRTIADLERRRSVRVAS